MIDLIKEYIGQILSVLFIVTFVSLLIWFLWSSDRQIKEAQRLNAKVVKHVEAGEIEGLTIQQGNFSKSTTTTVNTTMGTFVVLGRFSFFKGASAKIETRASGNKYFCVSGVDTCNRLVY